MMGASTCGRRFFLFIQNYPRYLRAVGAVVCGMAHRVHLVRIALATAFLSLIPLVAMQFTDQVKWGLADFAVAAALLFGAGLAYEFITAKTGRTGYRIAIGVATAVLLVLVWMELAVGIFGTPWAGS